METNASNSELFDENQSLSVIREMIQVSQKKLRNDGILFILWGWVMSFSYIQSYFFRTAIIIYPWRKIISIFGWVIGLTVLAYTIFYLIKQHKRVQTYIGISLRYVWFSLIGCLVLINLIEFNVLKRIIFELQHPIFMVLTAFAFIVTGGILRYKLIVAGGIVFALLAYISSYLSLEKQMLVEALAWLISCVVPGHILYSKRNN